MTATLGRTDELTTRSGIYPPQADVFVSDDPASSPIDGLDRYEAPALVDAETLASRQVITACGVCITGGGAVTTEGEVQPEG